MMYSALLRGKPSSHVNRSMLNQPPVIALAVSGVSPAVTAGSGSMSGASRFVVYGRCVCASTTVMTISLLTAVPDYSDAITPACLNQALASFEVTVSTA